MDTSLQNTSLTEDEMTIPALAVQEAEHAEGEEAHIHLPNGSLWPILVGISILVTMVGFVFVNTVYWGHSHWRHFRIYWHHGLGIRKPNGYSR